MTNGRTYDKASIYQIRIQGMLDASWSDWFDGFNIQIDGGESVLQGTVIDQAALHGVLAKINDLGLTIISVMQLPQDE
ncbi:MAG: hypothetical protein MUC85_07505 [Anaerolineales bacterium]|jgi:hypothetical protein|nr:hypothetical protein [Anaerolineales bacterium]